MACAPRGSLPSCTQCHDPDRRTEWGCDEPAAVPVVTIACFVCHGDRADCEVCHGTNEVPVHECPNRVVRREHTDAVLAVVQMEHGILPAPGGSADQSATFVEAVPLLMREVAHWRDLAMRRAREEAARKK